MKHLLKAALIATTLCVGTMATAASADARDYRHSSASVYFDFGNVSVGYRNGYYDHDRRWHRWQHARQRAAYREWRRARYYDRDYAYYGPRHRRHYDRYDRRY